MSNDLTNYKPVVSIAQAFEVDETLPDNKLTFDIFKKLVVARKMQDAVFLSIGKLLKLVRDRKLYKNLDFETFEQFLASEELSMSREKAYACIRVFELFVEKLGYGSDELGKMGIVRLMMLSPLIKDIVNDDEARAKVEELKELRYNDFVRTVKSQIDNGGKPNVYFSEEAEKWIVQYHENVTHLIPIGNYIKELKEVSDDNS